MGSKSVEALITEALVNNTNKRQTLKKKKKNTTKQKKWNKTKHTAVHPVITFYLISDIYFKKIQFNDWRQILRALNIEYGKSITTTVIIKMKIHRQNYVITTLQSCNPRQYFGQFPRIKRLLFRIFLKRLPAAHKINWIYILTSSGQDAW